MIDPPHYLLWWPRERFLALLAQGWEVVQCEQPIAHHGCHSILLETTDVGLTGDVT